jgi:hypothetical protein
MGPHKFTPPYICCCRFPSVRPSATSPKAFHCPYSSVCHLSSPKTEFWKRQRQRQQRSTPLTPLPLTFPLDSLIVFVFLVLVFAFSLSLSCACTSTSNNNILLTSPGTRFSFTSPQPFLSCFSTSLTSLSSILTDPTHSRQINSNHDHNHACIHTYTYTVHTSHTHIYTKRVSSSSERTNKRMTAFVCTNKGPCLSGCHV